MTSESTDYNALVLTAHKSYAAHQGLVISGGHSYI